MKIKKVVGSLQTPQLWQTLPAYIKKSYFPERLQNKNQKLEGIFVIILFVIIVCADPIYHHWVFHNLHLLILFESL